MGRSDMSELPTEAAAHTALTQVMKDFAERFPGNTYNYALNQLATPHSAPIGPSTDPEPRPAIPATSRATRPRSTKSTIRCRCFGEPISVMRASITLLTQPFANQRPRR